ncbi:hypothetical protein BABINDRAFT_143371 [Babjeviella inositovora NRRL Y-12698]|uniref:Uncharacterized protein n=1 Tax=Babjeviella inositovora NRRL Y-12698 TaxID=984486 RepID=A0A1E3QPV0_9ASCO|nr:uncharacterized protein BABINDRAFT_143371 [Babjeviella inositovora NRRL Y-12698]ODQ79494.1 hypothetical protein BABINDRAFT_143371 [Babjeviella inositovora NRRL Y-12698]
MKPYFPMGCTLTRHNRLSHSRSAVNNLSPACTKISSLAIGKYCFLNCQQSPHQALLSGIFVATPRKDYTRGETA